MSNSSSTLPKRCPEPIILIFGDVSHEEGYAPYRIWVHPGIGAEDGDWNANSSGGTMVTDLPVWVVVLCSVQIIEKIYNRCWSPVVVVLWQKDVVVAPALAWLYGGKCRIYVIARLLFLCFKICPHGENEDASAFFWRYCKSIAHMLSGRTISNAIDSRWLSSRNPAFNVVLASQVYGFDGSELPVNHNPGLPILTFWVIATSPFLHITTW